MTKIAAATIRTLPMDSGKISRCYTLGLYLRTQYQLSAEPARNAFPKLLLKHMHLIESDSTALRNNPNFIHLNITFLCFEICIHFNHKMYISRTVLERVLYK
jgi:hypothetical protein